MGTDTRVNGIPDLLFSVFQLTFAVITVALISGAIADRTKFGAWAVFTVAWATLVYFPVAHWVWGGGWLSSLGIEDFAGGTVVHVNAGSAGLALALVLGKRRGWGKDPDATAQPAADPRSAAGLLWFGWVGFNAGSELAADGTAALAFMNTPLATAAAAGGWLLVERYRNGKPTLARRRLRCRCRACRDHPRVRVHRSLGRDPARPRRRRPLLLRDRAQAQARLRRLARRGGRAPGRRRVRRDLARLPGRLPAPGRAAQGTVLRRRDRASLGVQALGPVAVGLYSFAVAWILPARSSIRRWASGSPRRTTLEGIDIAEHAESAYEFGGIPAHAGTIHLVSRATPASSHAESSQPRTPSTRARRSRGEPRPREAPAEDAAQVAGPR